MSRKKITPTALSIAGSDSGGGAGAQMDLRTFRALDVFGTSVVTAVTAQNLQTVARVDALDDECIESQIKTVLRGFDVRAAKTGMLWSVDILRAVGRSLPTDLPLVVDPVRVATSGAGLVSSDSLEGYQEGLLPRASSCTPNTEEASWLLGASETIDHCGQLDAARELERQFSCPALVTGGHVEGELRDVLCIDGKVKVYTHPRISGVNAHGSGCLLSAAITAELAHGQSVVGAVAGGIQAVSQAFLGAVRIKEDLALLGPEHIDRANHSGNLPSR